MGNVLNLDDLMGPKSRVLNKGGYPGPTLDDLLKAGFIRYNLSMMYRKDAEGKVLEVYKKERGEEYYIPVKLEDFEIYKTEIARRLKNQLNETLDKSEVKA